MQKSGLNGLTINTKERFTLENVSSLTIINYSDVDMFVTISGIKTTVPAYDTVSRVARVFVIDGDGTFSDLDFTVDFDGATKRGEATVFYRQYQPNKC